MGMLSDIRCALDRDPAARSPLEVVFVYPGLHALWTHRVSHWMWNRGMHTPSRVLSHSARVLTGVEIHPAAKIGDRVFIDHGSGVVIGETAEIGEGCTIYQGATLGGTSLEPGKRHPTLGRNVVVGSGAKILGPIEIGDNARIGANSVVLHDIPPGTAVVGVPGQVITRRRPAAPPLPERENDLPDAVGAAVVSLMGRVEQLERAAGQSASGPHAPQRGVWRGEDFAEVDFVI